MVIIVWFTEFIFMFVFACRIQSHLQNENRPSNFYFIDFWKLSQFYGLTFTLLSRGVGIKACWLGLIRIENRAVLTLIKIQNNLGWFESTQVKNCVRRGCIHTFLLSEIYIYKWLNNTQLFSLWLNEKHKLLNCF